MKLLLINPNITAAMTESMAAEARRYASASTEIVAVTAEFGTQYVENRVEAAIASHAVLDALAKHATGCDAAMISAFGDPGLAAAREFADIPVVGIQEVGNPHRLDARPALLDHLSDAAPANLVHRMRAGARIGRQAGERPRARSADP